MAAPLAKFSAEDRRLVEALARWGVPVSGIAAELGRDDETIRKHFAEELATARNETEAALLATIFRKAKRGSTVAARWWLDRFHYQMQDRQHVRTKTKYRPGF